MKNPTAWVFNENHTIEIPPILGSAAPSFKNSSVEKGYL